MRKRADVRSKLTTPIAEDFSHAEGTPIVIDRAAHTAAILDDTDTVIELGVNGGWKDLLASINTAKVAGANVPTWAAIVGGVSAYSFSATAMNEVWLPFPRHRRCILSKLRIRSQTLTTSRSLQRAMG